MSIVLVSRDLMTSSRVEGAAMRSQTTLKTAGTVEQAIAVAGEQSATMVIVDLTAGTDVAALVAGLRALSQAPKIVAFGPHVHEAALAAAQEAGCDGVLSRGQFFAQLDEAVAAASR